MLFCSNCGKEVAGGAKFCQHCGHTTSNPPRVDDTQRQQKYSGNIIKCPNCGEVLKSFVINCPACGLELRETKATNAVRELALKLEAIESRREYESTRSSLFRNNDEKLSKTDEQKVSLIQSFAIPTTKEDIYEFLILTNSNINIKLYESSSRRNSPQAAISDAWEAKYEQAYQKAQIVFQNDVELQSIQSLYEQTHKKIKKAKVKDWKLMGIVFSILIVIFAILFGIVDPQQEKKDAARLEGIVAEIESAIESKEYELALSIAKTLEPISSSNSETKRQWSIKREYWIKKVIVTAEADGVILTYEPEESGEAEQDTTTNIGLTSGFIDGFVEGFSESMATHSDGISEQIDKIQGILSGSTSDDSH